MFNDNLFASNHFFINLSYLLTVVIKLDKSLDSQYMLVSSAKR